MEENLSKRLVTFAAAILVVFAVALSSFLHKLDGRRIRREVQALSVLESMPRIGDPKTVIENEATLNAARDWLRANEPEIDNKRLEARQTVVDWLRPLMSGPSSPDASSLTRIDEVDEMLSSLSGKRRARTESRSGGSPDPIPFPFIDVVGLFRASKGNPLEREMTVSKAFFDLDCFALLVELRVIVETQTPTQDQPRLADQAGIFVGADLDGDSLSLHFVQEMSRAAQLAPATWVVSVTTKRETLGGPRLAALALADETDSDELLNAIVELEGDKELRRTLREQYAPVSVADALEIARQSLGRSYETIDVFGFGFSPRHLPFVVLSLFLAIQSGLLTTLYLANKERKKPISGVVSESALQLLMDGRWPRLALWAVIPPVSLLISLPQTSPSGPEYVALLTGAGVLAILGLTSSALASRL